MAAEILLREMLQHASVDQTLHERAAILRQTKTGQPFIADPLMTHLTIRQALHTTDHTHTYMWTYRHTYTKTGQPFIANPLMTHLTMCQALHRTDHTQTCGSISAASSYCSHTDPPPSVSPQCRLVLHMIISCYLPLSCSQGISIL